MPRYFVLDIYCRPCRRPGDDDNPGPRLARFVRDASGGEVGVQAFTWNGEPVVPYCHVRPDGGRTWRTRCPHGHDKPIAEERIIAAFLNAFPPGTESLCIWL
jgi:hypothetical protein